MFRKVSLLRNVLVKQVPASRSLYSETALGVDNYIIGREKVKQQFSSLNEDKFREKMNEFSSDKAGNMVFTEDLKNMVHLINKTPEDMELIEKMLYKYNSQNKELRFGLFVFGPVIMRMFYHLNEVDRALKLFKDPNMEGFFDQLISFQLLLDLLYENKRYDEESQIDHLCQIGQTRQCQPILRNSINVDEPVFKKRTFIKKAIDELKQSIEKNAEKDLEVDFSKIEKTLIQNGQINEDTIEQLLCTEIASTALSGQRRNKGVIAASFNEASNNNSNKPPRKPRHFNNHNNQRVGLNDMY
uniref:Uncharacterized protein n=1 Tax=Megaselia scalaris TaxID=36166 RepID=T1GC06_MEGSC